MGRGDESDDAGGQSGDGAPDRTDADSADESGQNGDSAPEDDRTGAGLLTADGTQLVTKRRVLGTVAVVLLFGLLIVVVLVPSSLLSLVYTSTAEFDAQPAAVDEGTLADQEYEATSSEAFVAEEEITVLGQTRTIRTTNHRANYERTIDVQGEQFDSAIFTVVTTPAIEVAGTALNPLAGTSHRQLLVDFADDLEGGYDGMDDLERVGEHDGVLLGQRTTVSQFETTVREDGEDVDAYLYVTTVNSGGDLVVAVGAHPAPFAQERLAIFELLAAVEHPVD